MTESLDEGMRGMGDVADYDDWADETPDTAAARGHKALTAALNDLAGDAVEGCVLEQVILYGTYTDYRGGYAGNLRRTVKPDELRAVLRERDELAEKLAIATRVIASFEAHHAAGLEHERARTAAWHDEAETLRVTAAQQAETIKNFRAAASTGVDLIRYLPGVTEDGRLALWYTDCAEDPARDDSDPIWTEDDAAEQVTELCLANLVTIAEQHERQHHADERRDPDPLEASDAWSRAQSDDRRARMQVEADLRAARDMLRRPDDRQSQTQGPQTFSTLFTPVGRNDDTHFSPGYQGEIPNHLGRAADCVFAECRLAQARREAAADIQQITAELFTGQDTE